MPELRKFLRDIAYGVPASLAVAALLIFGFGFGGTGVTVVSVMAGMLLGRAVDHAVVRFRANRAGTARTSPDPDNA